MSETPEEKPKKLTPREKITQLAEKLEQLRPKILLLFTILSLGAISAALVFVPRAYVIVLTISFFIGAFFSFLMLFVLAPGASKLIFLNRFIYHRPLAMLFDDTGNATLIKGKTIKKGPKQGYIKVTKDLFFKPSQELIWRFAGSRLGLCIDKWAGFLPIIAPVWAKSYEEQHGDEEANLVDEGGNPHADLDKTVEVPITAPVSVKSILKVMTVSYSPETAKTLELSLIAAAKARGLLDTGKLVLYVLMLMIGAGIFYTLISSGGGGISANIPSGGGILP